jgi:hypothetical protein
MQDRYGTPIEKDSKIQDLLSGEVYTVTDVDELDSFVETNQEDGSEGPFIYNTHIYHIVVEEE